MLRVNITSDAGPAMHFLVEVQGVLKRPRALNDALGRRLARELQGHFRTRNSEPNKLGGTKTNFWKQVADATVMTAADETGAIVSIGESRFRIHLFGGVVRPTGGRQALTIPIVPEAHGKRVSAYEAATGRKLFRVGAMLMERTATAASPALGGTRVTILRNGSYRQINASSKGGVRGVFVLRKFVTIKADPRALPAKDMLLSALSDTARKWADRENLKESLA